MKKFLVFIFLTVFFFYKELPPVSRLHILKPISWHWFYSRFMYTLHTSTMYETLSSPAQCCWQTGVRGRAAPPLPSSRWKEESLPAIASRLTTALRFFTNLDDCSVLHTSHSFQNLRNLKFHIFFLRKGPTCSNFYAFFISMFNDTRILLSSTVVWVKGSVQRKLRWFKNNTNRWLLAWDSGIGHFFVI